MINHFKSAFSSIWNNKIRSLLTMLGVVIGVTSVTTFVALGEGLKNDVTSIVQGMGTNIVAVIGGKIDTDDPNAMQASPASFIASDILSPQDLRTIELNNRVETASPLSLISRTAKFDGQSSSPMIMGVYPNALDILEILKVDKGRMFSSNEEDVIVINQSLAKQFFPNENPVGKIIYLGDDPVTIIGVLDKAINSSALGGEYNSISLTPFDTATRLNKGEVKIYRIMFKIKDNEDVQAAKNEVHRAILKNHKGDENFSVLTQDDLLDVFDDILNLVTTLVSAIAAISLIVGGIGIMNIMLVTVTERTREIGLRKAVGATKAAILFQFLIEAVIVTLVGGLIGLGISIATSEIIAAKTTLTPAISINIILIAVGISTAIGIIFGIGPAMRAANKDPIEALRYE